MSFTTAIRTCLAKYFTFAGRARRSEYWYFVLFLFLGSAVAGLVDSALFGTTVIETEPGTVEASNNGPVASLFALATFIPGLSAGWRRMHDTGRSGLYLIYPLIVMAGLIAFVGFVAGFGPLMAGDFGAVLAGGSAIVIGIALFVLFISPLLVLWWLTRPSDDDNEYGPRPTSSAAKEVTP